MAKLSPVALILGIFLILCFGFPILGIVMAQGNDTESDYLPIVVAQVPPATDTPTSTSTATSGSPIRTPTRTPTRFIPRPPTFTLRPSPTNTPIPSSTPTVTLTPTSTPTTTYVPLPSLHLVFPTGARATPDQTRTPTRPAEAGSGTQTGENPAAVNVAGGSHTGLLVLLVVLWLALAGWVYLLIRRFF